MRVRVRRLLGASALLLLFGLPLPGCSGQQQDGEDMEATEQGNEAADNQEAGGDDQQVANDQAADDNGGGDEQTAAENNNDATENDLQEIIQEMNTQQGTDPAAAGANPAPPPPTGDQPAPVNNTAAAPAPAPAPAAAPQSTGPTYPFQPGGTPAGPGLPELGSKMAYVVEKGDTLAKVSQKIYGSTNRWKELATLSGIPNPSRIFPGDLVYYALDESALAFAAAYESTQRAEESVKPGDTLATIAQRIYGTTTAWRSLWRQNDRIDNPDIVPPGTTVAYIPKGAATAAAKKALSTKLASVKTQKLPAKAKAIRKNTKSSTTDATMAAVSVAPFEAPAGHVATSDAQPAKLLNLPQLGAAMPLLI